MDVVERAGRLMPGTRADLLTNQLVVVGRPGGTPEGGDAPALASSDVRRVALGNPDSVPAGVYARRWLGEPRRLVRSGAQGGADDDRACRPGGRARGTCRRGGRLCHRRRHRSVRAGDLPRAGGRRAADPLPGGRRGRSPAGGRSSASWRSCDPPRPAPCSRPPASGWRPRDESGRVQHRAVLGRDRGAGDAPHAAGGRAARLGCWRASRFAASRSSRRW